MLKQVLFTGVYSAVLSVACAFLMMTTEHFDNMLVWALVNIIFVVCRWFFVFKPMIQRRERGENNYHFDHRLLLTSWFFSGLFWGVGGYLFLPSSGTPELFVSFVVIYAGITTGNIPNFWSSKAAGLLFVYPTMAGLALRIHEYDYSLFLLIIGIYVIFITTVIFRLSRVLGKAVSVDVENESLLKSVIIEKENALAANTEKSRFLAAASHDLRQPLNSLGLFLYSLRQKIANQDQDTLSSLSGAENAHSSLSSMFASLLEVSRFDEGSVSANPRSFALSEVLEPLITEQQSVAQEKGLNLCYQPSSTIVESDPILLGRIIRNFIDNAIKYTEHGSVTIQETLVGNKLSINIVDTGIGIAEHEQNNIFNEYQQIGNQKRNRSEGIGLGLSIVKRIADLLGHEISMSSEASHGSIFTVTVPTGTSVLDEEASQILDVKAVYGTQVLVIDDDTEILIAMTDVLEGWSYDVATAENLEQAVEQIQQTQPDIILCDYRLHDSINGVDALDQLYSQFQLEIPSVIVSGDNSNELNQRLKGSAYHFLSKPVQPQTLLGCLINVLNE